MPGAPRFTQKPSIQQTPQGDLLMECYLEADPPPDIVWHHAGMPIAAGPRVELTLTNLQTNLYKAILIIKEPNVGDGGAYKCTASNRFGESNANINLNFAGAGDEQKGAAKGPTFVSKPRIIPKNGGALIVMECRVKSISKPHGIWYKNGAPIHESALYSIFFSDLGDSSYLLQLELHNPVAEDAGQYRCNIRNDLGETNANLTLNFEQEPAEQHEKSEKNREKDSVSPRPASRQDSRPGSPRKQMKSREGTPKKSLKSRESTPRKSLRSRTATPTQEMEANVSTTATEISEIKTEQMETDSTSAKRKKSVTTLPPTEKKSRQKSPRSKSKSPKPEDAAGKAKTDTIPTTTAESSKPDEMRSKKSDGGVRGKEIKKKLKDSLTGLDQGTENWKSGISESTKISEAEEKKRSQVRKRSLEVTETKLDSESSKAISEVDGSVLHASLDQQKNKDGDEKYPTKSRDQAPIVIKAAKSKIAREGDTVILECEFQCDSTTKVNWSRDGKYITNTPDFNSSFDGRIASLRISHMTEDKSGLFKCTARNSYGESHSSAVVKFEHSEEADYKKQRAEAKNSEAEQTQPRKTEKQDQKPKSSKPQDLKSEPEEAEAGETSESKLEIRPGLQKEHMPMQQDGGASEEEMSESISELPSVSEISHKRPSAIFEQSGLRKSGSGSKLSRRRSSVDMRRENLAAEILDKPSTPLRSTGEEGPPRILEIPENVTVAKNDTAVLKCKIEGNPAPTFKWSKGLREIPSGGRCRIVTDQQDNSVNLVMQKCRSNDDGPYTLTIENKYGKDSAAVKLLVVSEAGLDFRSMLKHREHEEGGDEEDEKSTSSKTRERSMTDAERRQSLFPGKKVEKWEEPLENKTVQQQVDKICELKCTYSRPNAKIRWYKNKKEIFSGGLKYKIVTEKAVCTLIINNPEVDDSGKYTCEANGLPTTAVLTVDEPPMKYSFIAPLPNTQEIYRTKQGILTCKVNNKRAPLVWHHNGKPISDSDKRFLIESDAVGRFTLTIKEVIDEDAGEWMAKINSEIYSKVEVYVEEPRHTFVIPLKSQKVTENESATLVCDVNDKDANVEWWHDGVQIKLDGQKFIAEADNRKRRLIINSAKLEDHGEYKCTTKDDQTLAQLIVDALNKFIVPLADVEVVEKEDVDLRCETKDNKTPGIWSKNGKIITSMPGGKFETISRQGVHTLKISKIELSEGDVYEISVGGLEGSCVVTVLEAEKKPLINWKPKKIEMEDGKPETIKIPFAVKGNRRSDPKPVLYRNGEPVDLEKMKDFIEVVVIDDVVQIKFKDPKKEDTGKWTLELTNSGGTALAPFEVMVKDKPKAPKGPLETKNVTAKGCDLKWNPPDVESSAPVQGYVVEMQENNGKWTKISETKQTEFKVKNLKEGREYKFRVKAVNDIGQSEPLTSEAIVAKDPYTVPEKPRNMKATDINKDSLTLQWEAPENNGGSPVEKYVVERRNKSRKEWTEIGTVPSSEEKSVFKLVDDTVVEGDEYHYRVRAINKAGPGDPCDHGGAIKIIAKPEPPAFPNGGIHDLILKVGETIKYDLIIAGEPVPEASWKANDNVIKPGGRCKMITERGKHLLKIEKAERADSGKYTLTLKNDNGQCDSTAIVTVVGPPDQPKGPLVISDICGDGATLAWEPSADDGEYIVEAQDMDEKGKFVLLGSVPASETKMVVRGLKNKGNYKFRVKAKNKEGQSDPLTADQYVQIKDPWDEPGKPSCPEITDYDADRIDIAWEPPAEDGGAPIHEYIIEMKDPVTHKWNETGRSPSAFSLLVLLFSPTNATITGLKEGDEYQFRVKAVNKAGPGQPSKPSERQVAKSKFVPAWLKMDNLKSLTVKAGQSVKWDIEIGGEPAPEVNWLKSDQVLASSESLQIEAKKHGHTVLYILSAKRSDSNKYTLKVKNSTGEQSGTAELTVLDKPSRPQGPLQVSEVFENNCKLTWKPPEDDGGEPIGYYEVEKFDAEGGKWITCAKVKDTEAHIEDLQKGHSYQFRVKAVNREGASEPLSTKDSVIAKNPYDEPGNPTTPEVTDWDIDRVDLAWKPPDNDGGAPITGYVIEKRKKHAKDWTECCKTSGPTCEASVMGLKEGEEYQFRIRAINKAGMGEPSDPSRKVIAKHRNLKPHIDRESMKMITIKVGQSLEFNVPVSGEPPPEKIWMFNDKPIEADEHIMITNQDYKTVCVLKNAARKHAGKYALTASNINGTDKHAVDVLVIGRPSAPEGPLDVSDIHADHMNLEWKPPSDNGGLPIDHYEIEKMDTSTGRWVPYGRSENCKTTVQNLQAGKIYQFRVRAVNKEGESDPLGTKGDGFSAKNPYDVPKKVDKPEIVDWDKDHVDLQWKAPDDGGSAIEEYVVEIKDKHGKWLEAMKVPGSEITARVENLKEGEEYQFRIIAKNKAGYGEPSDPSDRIIAKPRHLAPHIHREDVEDIVMKVGQPLRLTVHIDGEPPPEITWTCDEKPLDSGVVIENEDYITKLTISKAIRKQAGSYSIKATNESGLDTVTFKIKIKGKPGKPKGPLSVTDVFEDHATLSWQPPEDDGGEPVDHYELERLDTKDGIWVPCGKSKSTSFQVENLIKDRYYQFRVKAINSEGSSEPLETDSTIHAKNPFEKSDKPGKPVPTDWDKDHVDLEWTKPVNDGGAPIEEYQIEKRSKYGRWESAVTVPGTSTRATVPNLTAGEEYEFRVVAVNKGGASEPSDPSAALIAKTRNLAPKIDRRALESVRVKAGQMIIFDVPVEGEPPPTVTWLNPNGHEIKHGGRVKLDNQDYKTKLQIRTSERSDSGVYKISAVNPNGEDEATVEVHVIDKPLTPEGPLNVTDVYADHVTLHWKAPADDGGLPIDNYVIERFDTAAGHWLPCAKIDGAQTTAVVDGLIEGHEYKFRVLAVNAEGESEPLNTFGAILTKNPYDAPGKTGKPEVTDWDKDHVDLEWTPPTNDGGASIEGYVIEMKEKFAPFWKEVKEVLPNQLTATISNLKEGSEYEFRIRAKNKAGLGDPSDPSNSVIAKPRHLAPKIDRNAIEEIKVRAGANFQLNIPVSGEPPPTITWTFSGEQLESTERIKIENPDYRTKFAVKRALHSDTGTYIIKAENENGIDVAEVKVLVYDRPGEPKGPLNVCDIRKNGCNLSWNEPDDDGGAEVTHYVVEKQDVKTGRWTFVGEAGTTNMQIDDLTPGHEYKFRIKSVNKYGESDPLEAIEPIIAKDPFDTAGKPGTPEIVDWDKEHVDLRWDPPLDDGGAPIEKYFIEKKMENGDWEYAEEVSSDQTATTIKQLKEGATYQFRVKAINKAGASTPSDPSRTLVGKARNLPPKIDRSNLNEIRIKVGSTIEFNVKVEGEPPPKIAWFNNETSLTTYGRTKVDNSVDYRTKLVTLDALRNDSGTYKIVATNENGKDEAEVKVIVLDAPGTPNGPLEANDLTRESCTLHWNPPDDDGGSPISHYFVEKQEAGGRWIPCGETSDTTLRISKLVEGKEYKFRVKAVNRQGESQPLISAYPVIAKNPFDEPGKPTNVTAVDWDKDHVDLEWKAPLNDGGAPVENYIVEKKDKFSDWVSCRVVPGNITKATVDNLIPGSTYQLRVRAVNKAGKGEPSDPTGEIIAKPKKLPPKIDLSGLFDIRVRAGSLIHLKVDYNGEPTPKAFWKINDIQSVATDRIEVIVEDKSSEIVIPSSVRDDTGIYTIYVENEHGRDKASCSVTVLDVPGVPEGPAKISNISKEGCILTWKPPSDDGGSDITHYVVEKMDTIRGTWQEVGHFPDCTAKVTKLIDGKEYKFRIKAVNMQGESKPLETEEMIARNQFDVPQPTSKPEITDWDKDRIDIEWKAPVDSGGLPIREYIIEKKEKGSPIWIETGRIGGNTTTFSTNGLKPGSEYEFRVTAVNEVGPSDPSEPSDTQIARPRYVKPEIISQLRKFKVKAGLSLTVEAEYIGSPDPSVTWEFKDCQPLAENLLQSVKNGVLTSTTSFFIPSAKRSESGNYRLKLKNEVGETSGLFEVIVQDKPSAPKGPVEITNVTKESCVLNWQPPEDDGGTEITNYVVEKRDLQSNTWTPVSAFVPGTTALVTKLIEGHQYEFRVMAENANGRSDPLNSDTVLAKDPFGTPGKPGRPVVTSYDVDHIDIEWESPKDNGGNPISHYDVERKDMRNGRWIKINSEPVKSTSFIDNRVQEGHAYEYRVRAVNKAGHGAPSDPSAAATAKPMFQAPEFDIDINGKEFRVRAGKPIDISVPYTASPKAEIKWVKNGRVLSDVETDASMTHLLIKESKRSDSGDCTITASNGYGDAQATIKISVVDRPGPPEGALVYPETSRHSVTLRWRPPEDDGGSELTGYRIEYQEAGSSNWMRVIEAVGGTTYTVRALDPGKQYRFRVRAENLIGLSEPLVGASVDAKDPFDPPGPPSTPEITRYDRNQISLSWNPPHNDGGSPVLCYVIEKFEKGGNDWTPVKMRPIKDTKATVTGLIEGETYQFRVRAVNLAGEGEPSGNSEPTICRPFITPPDAPDQPRVGKVTKNSAELIWNRPLKDGGAPIEGYIVEKRKAGISDWVLCNDRPVRDICLVVEPLEENEEYEFRVKAINSAGKSEPSKPTDMIRIVEEPGRPCLDLSAVKDITVKVGEDFDIKIPFTGGNPKPTATAFNGVNEIFDDNGRINIEVGDGFVTLATKSAKRSDAGPYRITLSNRFGKDTGKVNVNVLSPPGKPIGPITPSEIAGDAVTLHWSPPLDDGGAGISNYVVERREPDGTWAKVGQPVGTSFRVRNLENGHPYEFRVSAENQYGIGKPLDTMEPIIPKDPFNKPDPPGQPEPIAKTEDSITLQWTHPLKDGGLPIQGFVLEKCEEGGDWSKCIFGLINDTQYRVTGLTAQKRYEFRVAAVNGAGQSPWSQKSELITAQVEAVRPRIQLSLFGKDVIAHAGFPAKVLVPFSSSPSPEITWKKDGKPIDEKLKRLKLESNDFLTQLSYEKCERGDTATYTIKLENDAGSDSVNVRLLVVDSPSSPKSLMVSDVTPDSCVLDWISPDDDGGSHITNYILEKCHVSALSNDVWEKVSSFVRGTNYVVTGLSENERYKFRVRAENQYGISEPTELDELVVARYQFKVPSQPDPPSVRDMDSTWAKVEWEPPPDGGSKILGYILQYKEPGSNKWINADSHPIKATSFRVQNLKDKGEYEFRVIAKNKAGLSKPSLPSEKVQLKLKFGPPGPPTEIAAESIGRNHVTLTWAPPLDDGGSKITGYIVESREFGIQSWRVVSDYNVQQAEFTVPNLIEFHDYEFRITAVNKYGRGLPSLPSSPIKIQEMGGSKPVIVVKPANTASPYNRRAVFTCEAIGRPAPTARWLRNGREIPEGARYRTEAQDEIFKLIIKEVWDIDSGEYTCEVSNIYGSDSATATLTVQAPPVIEKSVGNAVYADGELVRLKIYFSGTGPFNYIFTLNKKEISADHPNIHFVDFDNHVIITIPSIHSSEAGRYELTISNESGEANTAFWLNVSGLPSAPQGPLQFADLNVSQVVLSWKPPVSDGGARISNYVVEKRDLAKDNWTEVATFVKDSNYLVGDLFEGHEYEFRVSAVNENGQGPPLVGDQSITARLPFDPPSLPGKPEATNISENSLTLSWARPSSDGGGRIRGYLIEKREVGTEIWQKCNYNPNPSTSCVVNNLIDDRDYEFRVFAVNDAGNSEPSMSDIVKYLYSTSGQTPEIITPLIDLYGEQGKSITLKCVITGNPQPEYQWYKGLRELTETSKYNIYNKTDAQVLVINDLHEDDSDQYSCRATNSKGTKSTQSQITVCSKPRVFLPPRYHGGYEAKKGEKIELKVPFRAFPQPIAKWFKNTEPISDSDKYRITTDDKFTILTISNVAREDFGQYRVVVENNIGSDSTTITLTVPDRPDPPRFPIVENILDEAAILSWKTPELDGGAMVTNYIVERRETAGGQWEQCAKSRYTYLTIEDLKPKHTYEFRIIAENKHGQSKPCEPTAPISIPEKRIRRKGRDVDDLGKVVHGKGPRCDNYDAYVIDVWKQYYPQSVEPKRESVYDYYDILEEIGSGAFGAVHRCVERATGNTFAAKFVNTPHNADKDTVRKEINTMSVLRHPKLINLHDAFEDDQEMVMIYEFMSGGELFEKISDENNRMSETDAINYVRQVCEALCHMHEMNHVHLDLKPENIMFTTRKSDQLKLIDFGLAAKLDPKETVKVTTGTAEFAAPEVVANEPVGFYTDMWSVGVLAYILLSGLSPFGGETDEETLRNVKKCDWNMDDPSFTNISQDGKDFIKKLLMLDPKSRMTVHEALEHPWLSGTTTTVLSEEIPNERYHSVRDSVRQRYDAWPEPNPPLGRISNYSSLKKHRPAEYHIHDTRFNREEGQPRFIIKPFSTSCAEGGNATFSCRVIASSPPIVTWYKDTNELKQSTKYMKKYTDNNYMITINRVKPEDAGEYTVRAKNSYGSKEEIVFLKVIESCKRRDSLKASEFEKRAYITRELEPFKERESAPKFSFHLRSRLIQKNHPCKLICNVQGNPVPKISWFKDGLPIDVDRTHLTYRSGVCTMELFSSRVDDAGTYRCEATNSLGTDYTECTITVQGRSGETVPIKPLRSRRIYDTLGVGNIERSQSSADVLLRHSIKTSVPQFQDDSTAKHADKLPTFISKLSSVIVSTGEQAEFSCVIDGNPEPLIEWLHNGERITNDSRLKVSFVMGRASLLIRNTKKQDEGEYCCKASNSAGSETNKADLVVKESITETDDTANEPLVNGELFAEETRQKRGTAEQTMPDGHTRASERTLGKANKSLQIIRHLEGLQVASGSAASFSVLASGSVDKVIWLKNGKEIQLNENVTTTVSDNEHRLEFSKVSSDDHGIYQVDFWQDDRIITSAASLVVLDRQNDPPVCKLPQSVTAKLSTPSKFILEMENAEGLTVQWFKGSSKIEKSDRIKSVKSGNAFKLDFKSVQPADEGVYVVKIIKDKKAICKYAAALLVE
uniref:non-specific serine/threonine protein kinase n=1 Tax=Setaria digitata TaxID=48799 RepID=A0A915Q578_9BILA